MMKKFFNLLLVIFGLSNGFATGIFYSKNYDCYACNSRTFVGAKDNILDVYSFVNKDEVNLESLFLVDSNLYVKKIFDCGNSRGEKFFLVLSDNSTWILNATQEENYELKKINLSFEIDNFYIDFSLTDWGNICILYTSNEKLVLEKFSYDDFLLEDSYIYLENAKISQIECLKKNNAKYVFCCVTENEKSKLLFFRDNCLISENFIDDKYFILNDEKSFNCFYKSNNNLIKFSNENTNILSKKFYEKILSCNAVYLDCFILLTENSLGNKTLYFIKDNTIINTLSAKDFSLYSDYKNTYIFYKNKKEDLFEYKILNFSNNFNAKDFAKDLNITEIALTENFDKKLVLEDKLFLLNDEKEIEVNFTNGNVRDSFIDTDFFNKDIKIFYTKNRKNIFFKTLCNTQDCLFKFNKISYVFENMGTILCTSIDDEGEEIIFMLLSDNKILFLGEKY